MWKKRSLFTKDGSWTCPIGSFTGKTELRRFFSSSTVTDIKLTEYGNGIIIQGDRASFEYMLAETIQGNKTEVPVFLAFELKDSKIQRANLEFDRLLVIKQAVKWWQGRALINFIVQQSEKL